MVIEGFGIHTPGAGRKNQVCSKWDTLHPGRGLARGLPPNPQTATQLEQLVNDFLAGRRGPAISPTDAVLNDEAENP